MHGSIILLILILYSQKTKESRYCHLKRPFLFIFIIVLLISIIRITQYTPPSIDSYFEEKADITCSGTIEQIVEKSSTTAIYLKDIQIQSLCRNPMNNDSHNIQKIIVYSDDTSNLHVKNQIAISGIIQKFTTGTNPGQFNELLYYKSLHIDYKIFAKQITILKEDRSYYADLLHSIRSYTNKIYEKFLPEEDAGIMSAMLLGEKSNLPLETKELYQKNGISHILAISGLHISMIGLFLYKLLKKIYIPNETAVPVTIFILISYGILTDFSVSTNRAVIMLILSLCSILIGRTYDFLTSICLSGSIILLQNPYQLCSPGFLLSFGAVFGVAIVFPIFKELFLPEKNKEKPLEKNTKNSHISLLFWSKSNQKNITENKTQKQFRKFLGKIFENFLISISVNLVTFPLILYYYFDYPIYSCILNLLILPCMGILISLGFLLAILGSFSSILGFIIARVIHVILTFYHLLCDIFLGFPNSILTFGRPSIKRILLFYVLLFLLLLICQQTKKKWTVFLFLSCFLLVLRLPSHTLDITMLDVGQGDGILIQSPSGTNYLIDGGSTSVNELEQYRISPCLKSKGISCIDYAIITHMDEDHVSGITSLLEKNHTPGSIHVKKLIVPNTSMRDEAFEAVVQLAKEQKVTVMYFQKGDKLIDGELAFTCMHPYYGFTTQERNDYSIVLYMKFKNFSMLFTGDVANEGEEALINNPNLPSCDIYKVAHHGSKYTNSDALLDILTAKFAIVSAGRDNDYGHPHEETLQRLSERKCSCFCTIDYGALQISSDGNKTTVTGFHDGTSTLFPKETTLGILK